MSSGRWQTPILAKDIRSAPHIGDRITQTVVGISYDCVMTGEVVAVNEKHRHYTLEFTMKPNMWRRKPAKFKECYKWY